MKTAQFGDKVKVSYTGKIEGGKSTTKKRSMELTIGKGDMFSGFEKGVIGMKEGQTKTVVVPPEEGDGKWDPDMTVEVNKSEFPDSVKPEKGLIVNAKEINGKIIRLKINDIKKDTVILDANKPLRGKTLIFNIKLIEIV